MLNEEKILQEVIEDLEYLNENTVETISGSGGWSETTFMGFFDKNDRNEMVKKLKQVYEFFEELNKYNV